MLTKKRIWFAWRPVRLGALSTGKLVWLFKVTRIDSQMAGITVSIISHLP